jgi:methylglutaconyl-CoA hydratase
MLVRLEEKAGIWFLTLNRPQLRNAISGELLSALETAVDELHKNPEAQVVVLSGGEGQAFCAGADLKERLGMDIEATKKFVSKIQSVMNKVASLPMATIACIEQMAFGGGLELALACDIRVTTPKASMGLTECALGIIPGAGGTQRLPRLVGLATALDLILTAKKISGTEAYRLGLVTYLAPGESAQATAHKVAQSIQKNAPLAIRAAKEAMMKGFDLNCEDGLRMEQAAYQKVLHSQDRLEGLAAFNEKRPPSFLGR